VNTKKMKQNARRYDVGCRRNAGSFRIKCKTMITIVILEWPFMKWEQLGWEMILKHLFNKWNK
jgi:hypothetical protein